ncbi:MAG TPA: hypothetical protein VFN56_01055 [Candidatus Saccharimonadales bacterium]|nr:hypothetical protein [Candidatus Saccharimonadales bacterium]
MNIKKIAKSHKYGLSSILGAILSLVFISTLSNLNVILAFSSSIIAMLCGIFFGLKAVKENKLVGTLGIILNVLMLVFFIWLFSFAYLCAKNQCLGGATL